MKRKSILMMHLYNRMHIKGMSNLVIITGKKGSGKSLLSLRFGEVLEGKTFGLHHVCFNLQQLFTLLDNKLVKPGDVVILEEIGVAANSRDAMTKLNKHLSFVAQVIRPACITLIVNTISWGLIDAQVKNLADYRIIVNGHDVQTSETEFKFLKISPRDDKMEPYKEHLIYKNIKCISWTMKRPSMELEAEYKTLRDEYMKQIFSDGATTSATGDDTRFGVGRKAQAKKKTPLIEQVEGVLAFKENYMVDGKLSTALIQVKLNCGRHRAQDIATNARHIWKERGGAPL